MRKSEDKYCKPEKNNGYNKKEKSHKDLECNVNCRYLYMIVCSVCTLLYPYNQHTYRFNR